MRCRTASTLRCTNRSRLVSVSLSVSLHVSISVWWSSLSPSSGADDCDQRVCLSVCLSTSTCWSQELRGQSLNRLSGHVVIDHGSVLHSSTLCISSFLDDVMFTCIGQAKAVYVGRNLKVTHQAAALGRGRVCSVQLSRCLLWSTRCGGRRWVSLCLSVCICVCVCLQTEIAKRLNAICAQIIPFLSIEVKYSHLLSSFYASLTLSLIYCSTLFP